MLVILFGLGGVAFITLLERKLLGLSQIRLGPNKVRLRGLLQPVADGIKLLFKDVFFVMRSQIILFFTGPIIRMRVFVIL
jgi:NADH:ubiquinone oxidoreductase subunit H